MNLRDLAANAARTSAGVWQGVANAIDTAPSSTGTQPTDTHSAGAAGPAADHRADAMVASGDAMLVPLDSWTRIVDQLANLHQAGQELAEARERAAKAETEVAFLKVQLAEAKPKRPTTAEPGRPAPTEGSALDLRDTDAAAKPAVHRRAVGYADRTRRKALLWIGR